MHPLPALTDFEAFKAWRANASHWLPVALDIAHSHGLKPTTPHIFTLAPTLSSISVMSHPEDFSAHAEAALDGADAASSFDDLNAHICIERWQEKAGDRFELQELLWPV